MMTEFPFFLSFCPTIPLEFTHPLPCHVSSLEKHFSFITGENVYLMFHYWFVFVVTFRVKYTCVCVCLCVISVCISSGSAARCVCRIPQLRPGAGECFHDWSLLTHIRYTDPWITWFWLVRSLFGYFFYFLSSYTSFFIFFYFDMLVVLIKKSL